MRELGNDIANLVDRAILVRDLAGHVVDWNREAERIYGWLAADALGQPAHALLESSHPLSMAEVERRLLADGGWTGELHRTARSGAPLVVELRCRVVRDANGQPDRIIEVGTDLSRLPVIERETRAMEHRYRNMFGGLTAALWELDFGGTRRMIEELFNAGMRDFRAYLADHPEFLRQSMETTIVIDVNDKTVELYEAPTRHDLIGGDIARFWPAHSEHVYAESLIAAVEAQPRFLAEVELSTWAGNSITVLHSVVWPAETKGKGTVLVGAVDLTPLRRAEGERRRSEARYRTIFQNTAVSFWELDLRGVAPLLQRLRTQGVTDLFEHARHDPGLVDQLLERTIATDVNEATIALFGARRREDLLGNVARFWPDAGRTDFLRAIDANFRGLDRFEAETRMATLDGRELAVIFTAVAPPGSDETGVIVIGILDISEREAARAAADRMRADLAHAARVAILGELATSIAHEVNQPLAAIASNSAAASRWLARPAPDLHELRDISLAIARDAERAGEVIGRIRAMAQKRAAAPRRIAINALVGDVATFLAHELDRENVALTLEMECGALPILGDPVQLQQVLINLAVNAIQAMRGADCGQRALRIAARARRGTMTIEVTDNGPGLAVDDPARLFDSFYTTKESGLGIGLAICRSIVEAHGGTITAANMPGGGAVFRFSLPCADMEGGTE